MAQRPALLCISAILLALTLTMSVVGALVAATSPAQIEIEDSGSPLVAGNSYAYTVTFRNVSTSTALSNVVITQTLPASTTVQNCIVQLPFSGGCTPIGAGLQITVAESVPTATAGQIRVEMLSATDIVSPLVSTVLLSSVDELTQTVVAGPAQITTEVAPPPSPVIALSISDGADNIVPGALLTYTISLSNTGTGAAHDLLLVSTISAGTTVVTISDAGAENAPGSGTIAWPSLTLAPGAKITRQVIVRLDLPIAASVSTISHDVGAAFDELGAGNALTAADVTRVDKLTLSGLLWRDTNGDGINVGESGIAAAQLQVTLPDGAGQSVIADDDGIYRIEGLAPGLYRLQPLRTTIPASLLQTYEPDMVLDGDLTLSLAPGQPQPRADFGYAAQATIDDSQLWIDLDANGFRERLEPGIGGVEIGLRFAGVDRRLDSADDTLFETVSSTDGHFVFLGLKPGTYRLTYNPATLDTAYALQSESDGSTDGQIVLNLLGGQIVVNKNFGFAALDLKVTKSDSDVTAATDDLLAYTIRYQNNSAVDAPQVELVETIPQNTSFDAAGSSPGWRCAGGAAAGEECTFSIGRLAAQASGSTQFVVRVNKSVSAHTDVLTNTVRIHDLVARAGDPTPFDNRALALTPVDAEVVLSIKQTDGSIRTEPGSTLIYTITLGNSGNEDASGVVVSQPVPIHTRFDAGNSSVGWDCPDNSAGGTICHFPIGKLAAGAQESIHFAMVLIDAMPVNVATIEALVTLTDDRGATDTDGELTPVDSAPDLALTSSVGVGTAQPRTVLTFYLNYRNIGNQDAIGVILEATVPQFTKFDLDSSAGGWDCADGSTSGATCTFNIGSLAAQAQDSIAFAVSVSGALPTDVQSIEFASVIAASGIEADVANNQATVSAPVVRLTETLFLPIVRRGP